MKTIKGFVAVLVAAVMCIGFAACGGGKSIDQKELLGRWKNKELKLEVKFKNDGECRLERQHEDARGTYKVSGSTIVITTEEWGEEEFSASLDGDKLTLTQDGESVEFTRKQDN